MNYENTAMDSNNAIYRRLKNVKRNKNIEANGFSLSVIK